MAMKSVYRHWIVACCVGINDEKGSLIPIPSLAHDIRSQCLIDPSGKYVSVDESRIVAIELQLLKAVVCLSESLLGTTYTSGNASPLLEMHPISVMCCPIVG